MILQCWTLIEERSNFFSTVLFTIISQMAQQRSLPQTNTWCQESFQWLQQSLFKHKQNKKRRLSLVLQNLLKKEILMGQALKWKNWVWRKKKLAIKQEQTIYITTQRGMSMYWACFAPFTVISFHFSISDRTLQTLWPNTFLIASLVWFDTACVGGHLSSLTSLTHSCSRFEFLFFPLLVWMKVHKSTILMLYSQL